MAVKAADVEQLVLEQGSPETLMVPDTDFVDIYAAYKSTSRDSQGVYIEVLSTKIRPARRAKDTVVDLGDSKQSVFTAKP